MIIVNTRRGQLMAAGLVGLLILTGLGGFLLGGYGKYTEAQLETAVKSASSTQSSSIPFPMTEPPTASKPYDSFGDGVYEVGIDIKPGIYKTTGAEGCYYARLASLNTDNIINNNITSGPATVEVMTTDKAFLSRGCGDWSLVQ